MRCLSRRNREAILLRWYRGRRRELCSRFVSMEEFDSMYKRLFGSYPLWYTWRHFYRDHGFVGLRSSI